MNSTEEYPDYDPYNHDILTNAKIEAYFDYDSYVYDIPTKATTCRDVTGIFMATALMIIFILGVAGNAVVIWIAGFKMKKSVNTTWYLSLAVSDFLFCCTLPFTVVYSVSNGLIFGLFMCKFIFFIMLLNMFSSIFLLVILSVDLCVTVMFPVWSQNHRTIRKASVIVTLVWIISAGISTPSLIFRAVQPEHRKQTQVCFNDIAYDQDHITVVVCRFVFGFVIPFLIIIVCYNIIERKLRNNQSAKTKKPFKIMTALTVAFLLCWTQFHCFALMELKIQNYAENIPRVIGIILACANSCVNPFLYAFIWRDGKMKAYTFLSKIENALEEENEDQSTA